MANAIIEGRQGETFETTEDQQEAQSNEEKSIEEVVAEEAEKVEE